MNSRQLPASVLDQAQIIWEYMHLKNPPTPADWLLVLGSNDLRVAEYAADLVLANMAPAVIFSGGMAHLDDLLATGWQVTEAEMFAQVALEKGVPANKIILETEALNTSKNFRFSLPLARANGLKTKRVLIVCKPYSERRAIATAQIEWGRESIAYSATSLPGTFAEYFTDPVEAEKHLNLMVGDLQRIALYPSLGIQTSQDIPDEVAYAFDSLVELGFDKHLLKDKSRILLP